MTNEKMNNFKALATSAVTISDLMNGREKIDTASVIRLYPDGVTLLSFDVVQLNDNTYPVFTIAEDDNVYYNGGHVLMKIVKRWIAAYDGCVSDASADLTACGGLKVKLKNTRTKNGNSLTAVEIIG